MCDTIIMPDGEEVDQIHGACLCNTSQKGIFMWILDHLPEIEIGQTVEIERTPFGYEVSIKDTKEEIDDYIESQIGMLEMLRNVGVQAREEIDKLKELIGETKDEDALQDKGEVQDMRHGSVSGIHTRAGGGDSEEPQSEL